MRAENVFYTFSWSSLSLAQTLRTNSAQEMSDRDTAVPAMSACSVTPKELASPGGHGLQCSETSVAIQ